MQSKIINKDEMDLLLEASRDIEHPYYYRFSFDTKTKNFRATRISKSRRLYSSSNMMDFLSTPVNPSSALGKSVIRIEKAKEKIGYFSDAVPQV